MTQQTATMTTAQELRLGVTVLDKGKPPRPFTSVPEGAGVSFESSNPAIASVVVDEDGMNATVHSDDVGTATITVRGTGSWASLPEDTIVIAITNAEPGALNTTVGAPTDES